MLLLPCFMYPLKLSVFEISCPLWMLEVWWSELLALFFTYLLVQHCHCGTTVASADTAVSLLVVCCLLCPSRAATVAQWCHQLENWWVWGEKSFLVLLLCNSQAFLGGFFFLHLLKQGRSIQQLVRDDGYQHGIWKALSVCAFPKCEPNLAAVVEESQNQGMFGLFSVSFLLEEKAVLGTCLETVENICDSHFLYWR